MATASPSDMEKQPLLSSQQVATSDPTSSESEPTLTQLQQEVFAAQRRYMQAWSRTTSGRWHTWIMCAVTALLFAFLIFSVAIISQDAFSDDDTSGRTGHIAGGKVRLEAHIMSKCPDARDCLRDMILPVMQRPEVQGKVAFQLSYIGSTTPHNDGVLCKHGQGECLGNIIELCAARLYPDPKISLGFTMCLTRSYTEIPSRDLIEDCALEHGISIAALDECTVADDGARGVNLLQKSFHRSAEAGVGISCTVRINERVRCVRDDGMWKDCEGGHGVGDLVRDILAAAEEQEEREGWFAA